MILTGAAWHGQSACNVPFQSSTLVGEHNGVGRYIPWKLADLFFGEVSGSCLLPMDTGWPTTRLFLPTDSVAGPPLCEDCFYYCS